MARQCGGAGRLNNKHSLCFVGLIAVVICQGSAYESSRNYRPLKFYTPTEIFLIAAKGLQHTGRDAPGSHITTVLHICDIKTECYESSTSQGTPLYYILLRDRQQCAI